MKYDFKCSKCGHLFEATFNFKDVVDWTTCPKCGKLTGERKYSSLPHQWKDGQKPS